METRKLPLRILYTVSGSQYILARSSSSVPVVLIPQTLTGYDQTESRPEFGTASLRTCLDAICISSPELVQDKRRDFSVYVLDPLESNSAPARVNIPNATPGSQLSDSKSAPEHPRGLAVALGLMSWALMPDERDSSTPVTGTVIKLPTGQEALEIIFALKETVAMDKSSLPAALRTWGLPPETTNLSSGSVVNPSTTCNGQGSGFSERHGIYATHRTHTHSTGASSSTSAPSSSSFDHVPTDSVTLATIASIHMRSQHKRAKAKAKKSVKTPSIDPENSEADRLLVSHYTGPERKKPGRPPNATASGSKSNKSARANVSKASTAVDSKTESPSNLLEPRIYPRTAHPSHVELNTLKSHVKSSKEPPTHPFTSAPLIRSPRDPEPQSLLDILAFLSSSSSSSDPNVQNSALLAALNAIDSSQADGSSAGSEKPPGPLLVNALRELISAAAQRQAVPPSVPNNSHPPVNNHSRNHLPDDDIVLLDKENVNPTVFRRRSEREGKSLDSNASTPATGSTPRQSNIETPASRGLTARPNGNINTTPVPPASASVQPSSNSNSGTRRKRTLSDFMDEREVSKGKEKLRDREWVERRDSHRYAQSSPRRNELSSIRHYPRLVSDITQPVRRASGSYYRTAETWSSPGKPNTEHHESDENSYQRPMTITDSPGFPKVSASSPVRSTNTKFRKPYVVPAWARTSTSMQPRLSEDAARALELTETKKKEERKARKRGALRVEKEKKQKRLEQSPSPSPPETTNRPKRSTPRATECPPPVTVASDGPMFAIAMQDRIAVFSSPAYSEPESPRSRKPVLPCTPPRKRNSDLFSPGEGSSLFTPVPGRRLSNIRTPVSFGSTRKLSLNTPKTPKASKRGIEDGNEASGEESEDELEDALNRELGNALDELDTPSGSLPAVSSDVENETVSSNQEVAMQSENCNDTDAEIPTKQHWVGLPPSSPPPPTSPLLMPQDVELLMPQDDESDDTMLPAVTSDADPCPTDSEVPLDSNYTNELSAYTDEELVEYLESDFASIFAAPVEQPTSENDAIQANMDLFDQFTNHKIQSDGPEQNTVLDPNFNILQEGLVDFDLTEFWETFKPLLRDQNGGVVSDSANEVSGQVVENQVLDPMNFDHMKLAEDVQALFSGCVV